MISRLAIVCLLLAGAMARAQQEPFLRGFDAVPLKPTAALESGIALEGAQASPVGSFRAALLLDSSLGILALQRGEEKLGDLIPHRVDAHLLFAWQLQGWLELAADVPLTVHQGDRFQLLRDALSAPDFPGAAGVRATALGDLRLLPRLFLLSPARFPVGLSLVAEVRLPTGAGGSFLGERGVLMALRLALERAFGPVRLLADVGVRLRPHAQYLNLFVDDELTLGAGAVVALPDMGRLTGVEALAEMHLSTPAAAPFTSRDAGSLKTPWGVLAGLRAHVQGPWAVELDVGRGVALRGGYGREAFRALIALRYDYTFSDGDGDGVPDDRDACPQQLEDEDSFQDGDGCPDPDNDGDGVLDGVDACPTQAGPAEYDGCPDADGDEVPDNVDKCPDEPGPAINDGCPIKEPPLVVIERERIRVKGNILFETGKAAIRKQSFKLLDEVAAVLTLNPHLGPILVEGHTDNVGSRAINLELSQRRAEAVMAYLVEKGIDASRLSAKGFGFSRPIASNATPLGRAKNRRVEFRIIR
jgi:outer membrane protein OmpA-like peptidoglycan-associated protein